MSEENLVKENPVEQKSDAVNPLDLNWLDLPGWESLEFPADPDDHAAIQRLQLLVKFYVRACLAMYNTMEGTDFHVTRFQFEQVSRTPLLYTVRAFLNPFVRENPDHDREEGGSHLIPQEPPPPDTLG